MVAYGELVDEVLFLQGEEITREPLTEEVADELFVVAVQMPVLRQRPGNPGAFLCQQAKEAAVRCDFADLQAEPSGKMPVPLRRVTTVEMIGQLVQPGTQRSRQQHPTARSEQPGHFSQSGDRLRDMFEDFSA